MTMSCCSALSGLLIWVCIIFEEHNRVSDQTSECSAFPLARHSASSLDAGLWWEIYVVQEANLGGSSSVGLKSEHQSKHSE